MYKVIKYLC